MYGYYLKIRAGVVDDPPGGEVPAAKERVELLHAVREKLRERWQHAVLAQRKWYNQRHQPLHLGVGDLVGLSTRNLRLRVSNKLKPKFLGPFRITEKIGQVAYRLTLPTKYQRLHDVFPITLLKP